MVIAVDFDGTIVEHKFPNIGREIPFAVETLKKLQSDGHKLILWSCRTGDLLQEALGWCRERGLEFYAANLDYPEENINSNSYSRKLTVDLYIDDRNLGGLPDWGIIYKMIKNRLTYNDLVDFYEEDTESTNKNKNKNSIFNILFKKF